MKHFAILLLCTIVIGSLSAQEKFVPGYYVKESNDTVRGFIQYKHSYESSFSFRSTRKGKTEVLTPETVKRFGIDGDRTFVRISYSPGKGAPETNVFGALIIEGEMDLLSFSRIFVMGSSGKYYTLTRAKSSDNREALKNYQANTGSFNMLLQDCPAVKEEAQNTAIKEENLVRLVSSYNQCKNAAFKDLRQKKGKHFVQVGVFAGASLANLSFKEPDAFPNSSYLYNSNFSTSTNPTVGLLALFARKGVSQVFSFQSELAYTSASFHGTFVYNGNIGSGGSLTQTTVTDLSYSSLSLSAGMRITARSGKANPYIALGVSGKTFFSMDSKVYQITQINASVEEEEFELPMSDMAIGGWAAAGVKWTTSGRKAIFIDVNYQVNGIAETGMVMAIAPRVGFIF